MIAGIHYYDIIVKQSVKGLFPKRKLKVSRIESLNKWYLLLFSVIFVTLFFAIYRRFPPSSLLQCASAKIETMATTKWIFDPTLQISSWIKRLIKSKH